MAKSTEKGAEQDPAEKAAQEAKALQKQRERLEAVLNSGKSKKAA